MVIDAIWLVYSAMLYSLRFGGQAGSFPKPLSGAEEKHYLTLAANGDLEARNILIERNLRLVAHIMNNGYSKRKRVFISAWDDPCGFAIFRAACIVFSHLQKLMRI